MSKNEKEIIGLTEPVIICGAKECAKAAAICDTGAMRTSIDKELSEYIDLGVSTKITHVKNPSINKTFKRSVVNVNIRIADQDYNVDASIQDRSHMTHKVIIGRDVLYGHFIVDVSKTHNSNKLKDIKDKDVRSVVYFGKNK